MSDLLFDGSVWCNVDSALRIIGHHYQREIEPLGLAVIEWYVLRTLYEKDGQTASALAHAVGRAATSFTPILDGLQKKELVERRMHPADRRSVLIYLTKQGDNLRGQVAESVQRIDDKLRNQFTSRDWKGYEAAVAQLQTLSAKE